MILARGELPSTEKKLRLAGADHVVLPATISALRMAHLITHPSVALRRADGEIMIHPSRDTYLAKGDSVILMGH
jgi:K+/H+ antiporter YhaU regulatory subunit KhtT